MTTDQFQRVRDIFHRACELDTKQRTIFLDGACADDEALRSEVEGLLRNDHEGQDAFSGTSIPLGRRILKATSPHNGELPERIAGYRIIRRIGVGGMAEVFEAEQDFPRRTVAIKVIRRGTLSRNILRRFEHEAQILGLLQHPCIAQIFEAGVAEGEGGAQMFVAMELIRGRPLTEFADSRGLGIHERLELIARVCDAVQYAHQKGIIHRDLKPANILVVDEAPGAPCPIVPSPKILDFGVARVTDADLKLTSVETGVGQLVGTLPYMSPEQVAGDPVEIDTRCDVYALGVLLFELLSGRLPHDLGRCSVLEAARVIRDELPPRLGTIVRALRGDIETIVSKASEKEKSRRYGSAADLASDIRRYLNGLPIEARRDSILYVFRKTVQRFRGVVTAACLIVAALAGFAVYAAVQASAYRALAERERDARQQAQVSESQAHTASLAAAHERDEARRARDAEAAHGRLAEQEATRARAVTDFLVDTLGLADPDVAQMPDLKMKDMLDRASEEVARRFENQPASEARVRAVIGRAYANLGELEGARAHLQRALELHEKVLGSAADEIYDVLWAYVQVLDDLSDFEWRGRWWQLWRLVPAVVQRSHPDVASAMTQLGRYASTNYEPDKVEPLRVAFMKSVDALAPDDHDRRYVADFLFLAGANLGLSNFPAPGCDYLRESLAMQRRLLPETHTHVVRTLGSLIFYLMRDGQFIQAEKLTRESLDLLNRVLPEDHWYAAIHRARLGASLTGQRRYDEAEGLLLDSLARVTQTRGRTNGYTCEILEHLVTLYDRWGKAPLAAVRRSELASALTLSDQTMTERWIPLVFGPEHGTITTTFDRLSRDIKEQSPNTAETVAQLLGARQRLLRDDDPAIGVFAEFIRQYGAQCLKKPSLYDASLALYDEAERIMRAGGQLNPWRRAGILFGLACNFELRHDSAKAELLAGEAADMLKRNFGNRDQFLSNAQSLRGMCLTHLGRHAEAEPLLLDSYEVLLRSQGVMSENTVLALYRLVEHFTAEGAPQNAVPYVAAFTARRRVTWDLVEPILALLQPNLTKQLAQLRATSRADSATLATQIEQVLAARRAALRTDEPLALLFADGLYQCAGDAVLSAPNIVWEPALREVHEIESVLRAPHDPSRETTLYILAVLLVENGEFASAELLAKEALEVLHAPRWEDTSVPFHGGVLAAALAGQGRHAEADALLTAIAPKSETCMSGGNILGMYYFGFIIDVNVASGRPARAAELAAPIMRAALRDASTDSNYLDKLAWSVVRRPGLESSFYAQSLELAVSACKLDPQNEDKLITCGVAQYRVGRYEDALATLTRLGQLREDTDTTDAAFLAMTCFRLHRAEAATTHLATLRRLVAAQARFTGEDVRSFLREAEALIR